MMLTEGTICTIIAKNYLAHARVLCASFLRHHPAGRCYVLIVDEPDPYITTETEPFEIIRLSDLEINDTPSLCFKYTVLELSTAVKPFLLRYLLHNRSEDRVLYLDPDILVTAPLDKLYARLDKKSLLLTPHLDSDYPDDGRFPNIGSILASGIFNLGFLGVRRSPESDEVLAWLEAKLYDHCFHDQGNGYFVDQKFFDLAYFLFPVFGIEYGVGYNVAYWNLHSRILAQRDGVWEVNREPLRFFHFSNYRPEQEDVISGYADRFTLAQRTDVAPLFYEYRDLLMSHGYSEVKRWPYSFGAFGNGYAISPAVRREYVKWLKSGRAVDDPFRSESLLGRARLIDSKRMIKNALSGGLRSLLRSLKVPGGSKPRR